MRKVSLPQSQLPGERAPGGLLFAANTMHNQTNEARACRNDTQSRSAKKRSFFIHTHDTYHSDLSCPYIDNPIHHVSKIDMTPTAYTFVSFHYYFSPSFDFLRTCCEKQIYVVQCHTAVPTSSPFFAIGIAIRITT